MEAKVKTEIRRTVFVAMGAAALSFLAALLIFVMAAPRAAGKLCDRLGFSYGAAECYRAQYLRTEKIGDLAALAETVISAERWRDAEKYCGELAAREDFAAYAAAVDEASAGNIYGLSAYEDYVRGNLVFAMYRNGKREDALAAALDGNNESYRAREPLAYYVQAFVSDPRADGGDGVFAALEGLFVRNDEISVKKLLAVDLALAYNAVQNDEKVQYYLDYLQSIRED